MRNFLKKYSFVISLLLMISTMGATLWFGIVPMYQKIMSLRDDIQKEVAHKENQERQIKRLPEIRSQYEKVLNEERYFDILLTENRMVALIQTIEALASQTGTEISIQSNTAKFEDLVKKKSSSATEKTSEKTGDTDSEDTNKEATKKTLTNPLPYPDYLRLTLTVKGDYTEIVAFLHELETLPVALDVLGVEVRQPIRSDNIGQGDVRSVSPFVAEGEVVPSEEKKDGEVAPEIAAPISPQLEAVFDTVIYIAKK
ncbi:MAG: hypothetical protein KIH67_001325 [Candidatus Moranbacteria bacterium]|nr:hypothetical protein [Candidatus Moranbacteria bacterium]